MIKINLALKKQSGVGFGEKGSGVAGVSSLVSGVDLNQFKELPLRKVLIPIAAGFAASLFLDQMKEDELTKLEMALIKLNSDNSQLQKELDRIKSYEPMKKTLDEDELTIKRKLETIQKLVSDRPVPLKILVSLSSSIPKEVWLTECKVGEQEVRLKGKAQDFSHISDFMKSLREEANFSSVDLVDTQQAKGEIRSEIASFELNVKRR